MPATPATEALLDLDLWNNTTDHTKAISSENLISAQLCRLPLYYEFPFIIFVFACILYSGPENLSA